MRKYICKMYISPSQTIKNAQSLISRNFHSLDNVCGHNVHKSVKGTVEFLFINHLEKWLLSSSGYEIKSLSEAFYWFNPHFIRLLIGLYSNMYFPFTFNRDGYFCCHYDKKAIKTTKKINNSETNCDTAFKQIAFKSKFFSLYDDIKSNIVGCLDV